MFSLVILKSSGTYQGFKVTWMSAKRSVWMNRFLGSYYDEKCKHWLGNFFAETKCTSDRSKRYLSIFVHKRHCVYDVMIFVRNTALALAALLYKVDVLCVHMYVLAHKIAYCYVYIISTAVFQTLHPLFCYFLGRALKRVQ